MKKGKMFQVRQDEKKKPSIKKRDKKITDTAGTSSEDEGETTYYMYRNKCVAVRVNKRRKQAAAD